mmetsp:Transcript_28925/g.93552  ORF Transcript_28925/g.93552 Transcript_28925/m.93552 type:complete len:390 (-) Transcript_28925:28-1197(-)
MPPLDGSESEPEVEEMPPLDGSDSDEEPEIEEMPGSDDDDDLQVEELPMDDDDDDDDDLEVEELPMDSDDDDVEVEELPPDAQVLDPEEEEEPPEDDEDDDDDFEEAMADAARPRKRARAGGATPKKRQKLSEEEKASRKAARSAATAERREAKKREEAAAAEAMKANRAAIKAGGSSASSPLAPYAGQSQLLGEVGDRINFSGVFLYHRSSKAAENDYGVKVNHLYAFVVNDTDVVQWWTTPNNDERGLLRDEGAAVDFAGTVKKHERYEGVDITTVSRLKVHVVDGRRVAKTPKGKAPRPKGGDGRVLDGDDDDDDAPDAPPEAPPSSSKKPRVAGGARRQKSMDNALIKEATEDADYEDATTQAAADSNSMLKELALARARRRQGK